MFWKNIIKDKIFQNLDLRKTYYYFQNEEIGYKTCVADR